LIGERTAIFIVLAFIPRRDLKSVSVGNRQGRMDFAIAQVPDVDIVGLKRDIADGPMILNMIDLGFRPRVGISLCKSFYIWRIASYNCILLRCEVLIEIILAYPKKPTINFFLTKL
jgi:hypothetical protein